MNLGRPSNMHSKLNQEKARVADVSKVVGGPCVGMLLESSFECLFSCLIRKSQMSNTAGPLC